MSNPSPAPREPGTVFRDCESLAKVSEAQEVEEVEEAVADSLHRARHALTAEGWALGNGPVRIGLETYVKR